MRGSKGRFGRRRQGGWWQLAAAALGAAADVYSANSAQSGARQQNKMNLQIAREQMGFQREMSSTAYQRAVGDLKAAGLNPMLAAMNGGASTPPGASAHMVNENAESSRILSNAVPKAINTAMGVATVDQVKAQTQKTSAETRKTTAEARAIEDTLPFTAQNAKVASEKLKLEFENLGVQVQRALQGLEIDKLTVAQQKELMPLVLKFQDLQNRAVEYGLAGQKADSDFWKAVPEGKFMQLIKDLGILYRSVGPR